MTTVGTGSVYAQDDGTHGYGEVARHPEYRAMNLHLLDLAGIGPGAAVVDLACGPAVLLDLLAATGRRPATAWALDSDPAMVAQAERLVGGWAQVGVAHMDEVAGVVPAAAADAVLIGNAIHLAADPAAVFGQVARVLRPGGVVAASSGFFEGAVPPADRGLYTDLVLRARRKVRAMGGGARGERPVRLTVTTEGLLTALRAAALEPVAHTVHDVAFDERLALGTVREPMFAAGALPGVAPEVATAALVAAVRELAADGLSLTRRYLLLAGRRPA